MQRQQYSCLWMTVGLLCGLILPRLSAAQSEDILKILQKQQQAVGKGPTEFAVSPPSLKLRAQAGSVAEATIVVYNGSANDARVRTQISERKEVRPGKFELINDPAFFSPDSIAKNLEVIPKDPTLASHTEKELKVRVRVTPGMKGTIYGILSLGLDQIREEIRSSTKEERGKYISETGIGIAAAQGVPIALTVEGSGKPSFALEKGEVIPPTASRLLQGKVTVRNTSDFEFSLAASAVVLDGENNMTARLKPQMPTAIKQGQVIELKTSPSAVTIPPGSYRMVFTVSGEEVPGQTRTESFTISR